VPILKPDELDIISISAEQTRRMGIRLGKLLSPGDVVCLSGDMGAGKTVFAAGIGQGWGTTHQVTSPTFNLVHAHRRQADHVIFYHLDCYRLERPSDADSIGLDDILDGDGVVVFEWPERIQPVLPKHRLWITFRVLDETRRNLIFQGNSPRYVDLITQFRESTYGV